MYRFTLPVCWLAVAVAMLGCGGESVETAPVAGTVTYNGSPVEGADVVFHPKSESGRVASAKTDAEGKFTLSTYVTSDQQEQGAVPGEYGIVVSKIEISGGTMSPEQMMSKMQEDAGSSAPKAPPSMMETSSKLPEKYGTPAKSPLSATVPDGGVTDLKLELTDGS